MRCIWNWMKAHPGATALVAYSYLMSLALGVDYLIEGVHHFTS